MLPPLSPIAAAAVHTPRLILRPMQPTDREAYLTFEAANAPYFARFSPPVPGAESPEAGFAHQLARTTNGLSAGTAFRCIILGRNGELVGMIGLSDIVRGVSQRCNIGYSIGERHTRLGLGLEAVAAMLGHAFTPSGLNLHRVECAVQPDNVPSLRLASRAGFRHEGFAPRFLFIGGAWRDHILLAKTAEEHLPAPPLPTSTV